MPEREHDADALVRRQAGELVLRGLLRREHEELYLRSATFHAQVDALVGLLPSWVDGLAAGAVERDRRIADAVELAKRIPPIDSETARALFEQQPVSLDEVEVFEVYSVGPVAASVCTNLTDEEAADRLMRLVQTGVSSRWERSPDPFAGGAPNPSPCSHSRPGCRHVLFTC